MKRPYLALAVLGFVFLTLALTGRSNLYYLVAGLFFVAAVLAYLRKR